MNSYYLRDSKAGSGILKALSVLTIQNVGLQAIDSMGKTFKFIKLVL
jgi:hypothetical protein